MGMAIGIITDGIKIIERVSYDEAYAAFKERHSGSNLVNYVHERRGKQINRHSNSRPGSRGSIKLEHNDKVIIPTKYQERLLTPSKYRNSRNGLEKYEPGDKIIIPPKYQKV